MDRPESKAVESDKSLKEIVVPDLELLVEVELDLEEIEKKIEF